MLQIQTDFFLSTIASRMLRIPLSLPTVSSPLHIHAGETTTLLQFNEDAREFCLNVSEGGSFNAAVFLVSNLQDQTYYLLKAISHNGFYSDFFFLY